MCHGVMESRVEMLSWSINSSESFNLFGAQIFFNYKIIASIYVKHMPGTIPNLSYLIS